MSPDQPEDMGLEPTTEGHFWRTQTNNLTFCHIHFLFVSLLCFYSPNHQSSSLLYTHPSLPAANPFPKHTHTHTTLSHTFHQKFVTWPKTRSLFLGPPTHFHPCLMLLDSRQFGRFPSRHSKAGMHMNTHTNTHTRHAYASPGQPCLR